MDEDGTYVVSNTAYLLTGNNIDYLLKMLNSKVVEYSYRTFYATMLGKTGLRWLAQHIVHLPIPLFTNTPLQKKIINEYSVDELVADLYRLSSLELSVIMSD